MSVLIKGMKMPGSCFVCPVSHCAYYRTIACGITGKTVSAPECEEKRMESCPLVPVPPHGSLIEKHDVFKLITAFPEVDKLLPVEFMEALYNLPTIIPASEEGE